MSADKDLRRLRLLWVDLLNEYSGDIYKAIFWAPEKLREWLVGKCLVCCKDLYVCRCDKPVSWDKYIKDYLLCERCDTIYHISLVPDKLCPNCCVYIGDVE